MLSEVAGDGEVPTTGEFLAWLEETFLPVRKYVIHFI